MARIPYPPDPPSGAADAGGRLPAPLNLLRMYAHAPAVAGPVAELGLALLARTSLPPRLRELVIMAVAARTGCPYEAVQHTPIALDAGLGEGQLRAVMSLAWDEPGVFDAKETAVLAATAELLRGHKVSEPVLAALREACTDREVVELVTLAGYYAMLAGFLNGLDVDIDPAGERFAALVNRRTPAPGADETGPGR
jgi:AhpD family alkylhydroperoxidase